MTPVRGHVEWDCSLMPDPVIMRSNGDVPIQLRDRGRRRRDEDHAYHSRPEEHLANTPVQALIHQALGNPMPVFAHIPFITAPGSTKKLSKRDVEKLRNSPQLKKMFDRADEVFPSDWTWRFEDTESGHGRILRTIGLSPSRNTQRTFAPRLVARWINRVPFAAKT